MMGTALIFIGRVFFETIGNLEIDGRNWKIDYDARSGSTSAQRLCVKKGKYLSEQTFPQSLT